MSTASQKTNPLGAQGAQASNMTLHDAGNLSDEQACVNPVTRSELHELTGAVLAGMDLPETIKELKAEVQSLRNLVDVQIQILKAFGDLYLELTDKTADRRFLERAILRAERMAARDRIPTWFWRAEEGLDLKAQLVRRAQYLRGEGYGVDDAWDLLREYLSDWAHVEVDDERLSRLVGHIFGEGRKKARAA